MTSPSQPANIFTQQKVSYGELKLQLLDYLKQYGGGIAFKNSMELKLQLSFCHSVTGNINEAELELKSCEEYILTSGKPEEKACLYQVRARICLNQSKYEEGLAAAVQSLHMFRQLQFPLFTRITCMVCGHLCSHSNLFTEAMEYLAEAHTVALQMGDARGAITSSANLNDIRIQALPAEECIWYNKELLKEIEREYKDEPNPILAGTCLQLAHLYLKQNDIQNADLFANKTSDTLRHLTHLPPHYFLYTNLYATKAEIASILNSEDHVIKYAGECASRGRQAGKIAPEIDANLILFRFYLKQKQLQKAKQCLDHAASILPESDKSFIYLQVLESKCLYFNTIGDTAEELEQFKRMHEYKMKTHEEASKHRSNYLAVTHDLEIKKKQIEEQKTELSFKTQELNMTSYHLEQRNRLLTDLEQSISDLKKSKPKADVIFNTLSKTIERAFGKEEEEKSRFRQKFDETHREFIAQLHRSYPVLSPTECRVSALLRSGFNTKEIANLLSTSQRTVENQRLSIRKKMNLGRDENLNLLLNAIPDKTGGGLKVGNAGGAVTGI